ncbi:DUF4822 domain-containing protein [Bacillus ndiopicus]|uniref:DUF4822 domain-containing protein n=1 Tax=Bacillus ndiopicus TaxID=1347368 RepID=UPI0005AA4B0D|nr:DUF4822 domain-containing protein [Bacillus ndiopicus]
MNTKFKMMTVAVASSIALLTAGYGATDAQAANNPVALQQLVKQKHRASLGQIEAKILGGTHWQGTRVYDAKGNDLTKENANFIGLAKYDEKTGHYEFFDAKTGETRGDRGTFFITNDGAKRILISETMNYQAVVDLTELSKNIFTYKRMGKDKQGNDVEVYVEHKPYKKNLKFTTDAAKLNATTGTIVRSIDGDAILGSTLWNGTKVFDDQGNDVTEFNSNFLSIAKFDEKTSKYEFFNIATGESRGDYGYFDVLNKNKIRAHVSIGTNKYGAALELTEVNTNRFTYKRMGKNAAGEDVVIFVEHEPYTGDYKPNFSF